MKVSQECGCSYCDYLRNGPPLINATSLRSDASNHRWREIANVRERQSQRERLQAYEKKWQRTHNGEWRPANRLRDGAVLAAVIICALSALFMLYVASCGGTVCGR